jgi:hypothetical protein
MFSSRPVRQCAIFALLLTTLAAKTSSKPSDAELAAITARGVLLAEYDTAAWQATDAVTAAHPRERTNLYIARKTDTGWIVDLGIWGHGNMGEYGDRRDVHPFCGRKIGVSPVCPRVSPRFPVPAFPRG